MNKKLQIFIAIALSCFVGRGQAQIKGIPPHIVPFSATSFQDAKPWVVWYFMHASYSKEGIKADLEAMAANNIAGAYFTPIKDKTDPPLFDPPSETLTPEWWDMFRYLITEAKKHNIQIALFPNDGFATAGGPWITPEQSMQKVVFADTTIHVSKTGKRKIRLPQPQKLHDYYQDIQLIAMPLVTTPRVSYQESPKVSSSYAENLDRLAKQGNLDRFANSQPGWIQYEFKEPFPCNSLKIERRANSYNPDRLKILVSNDGINFKEWTRLESPRTGWLDWDNGVTHTIPFVRAKYFRFVFDPHGSEPGSEDLDAGKWKPSINLLGIALFEEAKVNQFEGKTGELWRVSLPTTPSSIQSQSIWSANKNIVLPSPAGSAAVEINLPVGTWRILRIGHTTTGHKNETAGAGKGLECDKLDEDIVAFQFEQWFGKAKKSVSPELSKDVITVFHIDSWESGSQNWTKHMAVEFQQRRGYALTPYLPVLAGYIVNSVAKSEAFLHDYRETIAALLQEKGFQTLRRMSDKYGVEFTAETTAPVMVSDGLSHLKYTDRTMGEFWFRSPSHDKPNDVLDAVSGAHIYGKNVAMSEAFTQIRMEWDEHPRLLKSLQDRNYALGVNNLAYHVYVHNPWIDRKPGMTLDGVGSYIQRDQIWWKPGKAWMDYAVRTQQLLQHGKPVRDIAVFIGEEVPRRAVLPDRLVNTLPGLIGKDRVERTDVLMRNEGQPMQKIAAVNTSANMYNPIDWVDPFRGYAYDSFNPDALLKHATVVEGTVVLSNHIGYKLLVVPGKHALNPTPQQFSLPVLRRFAELIEQGATVLFQEEPTTLHGIVSSADSSAFAVVLTKLFDQMSSRGSLREKVVGKGKVLVGIYQETSLEPIGLIREDVIVNNKINNFIAWNHRAYEGGHIYFVSNQDSTQHDIKLSLRNFGKYAYRYDAVQDKLLPLVHSIKENRANVDLSLDAYQSFVILFSDQLFQLPAWEKVSNEKVGGEWTLQLEGVKHKAITQSSPDLWSASGIDEVRYHSGIGIYSTTFNLHKKIGKQQVILKLEKVENLAEIFVNGKSAGVIWTKPYEIDVTEYLRSGENKLEIKVYNTWGNRFGYEVRQNPEQKLLQTTAPSKFLKELQPAGLKGEVKLIWFKKKR